MSQTQVLGFRPATARRILKQLNIEGDEFTGNAEIPDGIFRLAIAYTHSGTITAGTSTTPGTGVATLKKISSTTGNYVDVLNSAGAAITVTVKNTSSQEIAASQIIQIKKECHSGHWLVDVGACS